MGDMGPLERLFYSFLSDFEVFFPDLIEEARTVSPAFKADRRLALDGRGRLSGRCWLWLFIDAFCQDGEVLASLVR